MIYLIILILLCYWFKTAKTLFKMIGQLLKLLFNTTGVIFLVIFLLCCMA